MKAIKIIGLFFTALPLAAILFCGCGASSPTTPAQIPTSVEYIEFTGDSSVALMGKTLTFEADADASDLDITITNKTTGETDAACGEAVVDGENVTINIGNTWADNGTSGCNVTFQVGSTSNLSVKASEGDVLLSMDYRVALIAELAPSLNFQTNLLAESAAYPWVDTDSSGNVHICYSKKQGDAFYVYYAKYDYRMNELVSPILVHSNAGKCIVKTGTDKIGVFGMGVTDTDYYAYSTDGGQSFSSSIGMPRTNIQANYSATVDANDVFHFSRIHFDDINVKYVAYLIACSTDCDTQVEIGAGDTLADANALGSEIAVAVFEDKVWVAYNVEPDGNSRAIKLKGFTYNGSYAAYKELYISDYSNTLMPSITMSQAGDPIVNWIDMEEVGNPYSQYSYSLNIAKYDVASESVGEVTTVGGTETNFIYGAFSFVIDGEEDNYYSLWEYWDLVGLTGGHQFASGIFTDNDLSLNDPAEVRIADFRSNFASASGMSREGRFYITYFQPNAAYFENPEGWVYNYDLYDVYITTNE